jgi:hypothetical protein
MEGKKEVGLDKTASCRFLRQEAVKVISQWRYRNVKFSFTKWEALVGFPGPTELSLN